MLRCRRGNVLTRGLLLKYAQFFEGHFACTSFHLTDVHIWPPGFHGIVPRVWPQCHLLLTVDTGSFSLYGHQLSQSYTEGIPIYSPLYGATEGLLGLNINPRQSNREYLLLPRAMFFEFIPIEHSEEDQPKTLFMDQVKI